MKKLGGLLVLAALAPAVSDAGEVFGVVRRDGGQVADGAQVSASCGASSYGPATADKKGAYRLVIGQTGKCTLTVTHGGKSATLEIVSFEDAAQADIVISVDASGKMTARRG
jgi:hypothetical protein